MLNHSFLAEAEPPEVQKAIEVMSALLKKRGAAAVERVAAATLSTHREKALDAEYRAQGFRRCAPFGLGLSFPAAELFEDELGDFMEHAVAYRRGNRQVLVTHVYNLDFRDLERIVSFGKTHGWSVAISAQTSSRYPGRTVSLHFWNSGTPLSEESNNSHGQVNASSARR